jgi:hypothetical protein
MVDIVNHHWACRSLNSMASPLVSRETYENRKPKLMAAQPMESGLDVKKAISIPVEAELFS